MLPCHAPHITLEKAQGLGQPQFPVGLVALQQNPIKRCPQLETCEYQFTISTPVLGCKPTQPVSCQVKAESHPWWWIVGSSLVCAISRFNINEHVLGQAVPKVWIRAGRVIGVCG